MNLILFGAAGFIGKNLAISLAKNIEDTITLVDTSKEYFDDIKKELRKNTLIKEDNIDEYTDFGSLLAGQDIVYHLVSTTAPTTSNQHIALELEKNLIVTVYMLEACIRNKIKKIIFFSSGGTVYGKDAVCPIDEDTLTYPICSYGLQKVSIEKLLYLYWYMYGLDYRVIRLANPYGPYQRPNGSLGAVTTFTYKALKDEEIVVYGDGSVVRDFIYIDDVVKAVENIVKNKNEYRIFNVGCGYGVSIKKLLEIISEITGKNLKIIYKTERKVDVPENYLNISRYEKCYGKISTISLQEGIKKLIQFINENYPVRI